MFKVKRLIWAVDPFSDLEASDEKCLAFLNALNGSQPGTVEIEPVYVITPLQVTELAVATQEFKVSAEKRLETRFKKINLPGVLPYKIIKQKGVSIRERVHTLLKETMPWLLTALLHGTTLPELRIQAHIHSCTYYT